MNGSNGIKESKLSRKRSKKSQKAGDKSSKKKKKRKTKDPDAPKRPLGAYFYYFKANNDKIKQEHPEFIQKEVVAKIAQDWKRLPEEQKQPFVEQSNEDKKRYIREKEEYDERKRKEEEEAGGNEENKFNAHNKNKRGKGPGSNNYDGGTHKRCKPDTVFNIEDEKEVRLKDIIGSEQISYPSDSEDLAAYSPPPLSIDGSRLRTQEQVEQPKRTSQKDDNNQAQNEEEEAKERLDSKHL